MRRCDCSNCCPEEAEDLWLLQPHITNENYDEVLAMNLTELTKMLAEVPPVPNGQGSVTSWVPKRVEKNDPILTHPPALKLVDLQKALSGLFYQTFTDTCDITPDDIFPSSLAWKIAKNIGSLDEPKFFEQILSSEVIKNQYQVLLDSIKIHQANSLPRDSQEGDLSVKVKKTRRSKPKRWVPQSVEGARLEKERAAAKKVEKAAIKAQKEHDKDASQANRSNKRTRGNKSNGKKDEKVTKKKRANPSKTGLEHNLNSQGDSSSLGQTVTPQIHHHPPPHLHRPLHHLPTPSLDRPIEIENLDPRLFQHE
ncbi:uncharacterized protein MELLADRAFT_86301 [Melampsora larici-populina 98AG31]|uniref:Uncharacterized protein n=1 Tax=Melampsora larici-populina (strain 98AG31 / pathotype 3-4-7) TaxID=747676 RepID=F4RL92_MELLP|nr:uncharacterized protein MELLADRAFT_86301 [Melampsora larici-populina 98AG31]EGG06910.1 hypothetical protein MELLADRAFT_86301 [Melampsora larici-populina 98AG31]